MSTVITQLSAHGYQEELLLKMEQLRQENTLCDITLVVENRNFHAHKVVLSSASPFFRALFGNDMKESRADSIELNEVDGFVMEDLLQFVYTGKVNLNIKNIYKMIAAADFLLLTGLVELCSNFLYNNLTASTCFSTAISATKYKNEVLQHAAANYARKNFVEASKSEEFLCLDSETVVELISDDDTVVNEEEEVYEAVIRWVEHDYEGRKKHFEEMFQYVRVYSISRNYLRSMLQNRLITESSWCMKVLFEELKSSVKTINNQRKVVSKDYKDFVCCGGRKSIIGKYNIIYHCSSGKPTVDKCECKCADLDENMAKYEQICG